MRRGFKQEAEVAALELRRELGLRAADRLDPFAVAEYLGVPVYPLRRLVTFGARIEDIRAIKAAGRAFSAMTVRDSDGFSLVVYNERHSPRRLVNSVMHELCHLLEGHEPQAIVTQTGRAVWDRDAEDEADWLAAAALVPRAGALALLERGTDAAAAAKDLGVSDQLFLWRARKTGVYAQLNYRVLRHRRVAPVQV